MKRILVLMLVLSLAVPSTIFAVAEESSDSEYIESVLNLVNNDQQEWSYDGDTDSWTLSIVSYVAYAEIEDEEGVSVCVPGAYVKGIDTNGDGETEITSDDEFEYVNGSLVIDYDTAVTSTHGQVYTAATAPVILNTGAAGYASATNTLASSTYAAEGYINVACGNRGKQDTAVDANGDTYYTGDAPSCLADQKACARFIKYNILLGNLPGCVDRFVSTGGSGGGAHATMFALTSDNPDFYDYQIAIGAVGVYKNADGSYDTSVVIDGDTVEITDGAWGCVAYSAITSLKEADMAMAFEYYMDVDYDFSTPFQAQLAQYLSQEYMEYINDQDLSINERQVGFDLNKDGDIEDDIALTIEYDPEAHPETNGYYGSYLDLYLDEFVENLQWYLDNIDYAEDWTWFDSDGNALSDEAVAAMTSEDKALAFIEGRYTKSSSGGMRDGMGGMGVGKPGDLPDGEMPADLGGMGGELPDKGNGTEGSGDRMIVGTPDSGTTQAAGSGTDSANYATYEEMLASYQADVAEIEAGDAYGKNIVQLYDPLNYIGADDTNDPAWIRIMMGAAEGDMSMFSSLNIEIAALNAGIDADIQWQWDGGHVPSEIFEESLALYVDQMVAEDVEGAVEEIEKEPAQQQLTNGSADTASGTDISSWVDDSDLSNVSFTLADAVSYRTAGASKAIPGFDVMDYGQEDYVFGNTERDARHWDSYLLEVLEKYREQLEPLFNAAD